MPVISRTWLTGADTLLRRKTIPLHALGRHGLWRGGLRCWLLRALRGCGCRRLGGDTAGERHERHAQESPEGVARHAFEIL